MADIWPTNVVRNRGRIEKDIQEKSGKVESARALRDITNVMGSKESKDVDITLNLRQIFKWRPNLQKPLTKTDLIWAKQVPSLAMGRANFECGFVGAARADDDGEGMDINGRLLRAAVVGGLGSAI